MSRRSALIVCVLASSTGLAAVDDGPSSRFIGFHGTAGTGVLLGYESTSTLGWTFGPSYGKPLNVSYAAAIRGGVASGFGMVIGGRRGRATGYLELSYSAIRTREQDAGFEREGSVYDPVNGYVPLVSGPVRLPAGWLRVSSSAAFIGFAITPWRLAFAPYAGLGLGVLVMNASSGWTVGVDGKPLDETKFGMGVHLALGVRASPGEQFFGWIELRPGWHLMSPFDRGADWGRTRDEFVLQLVQVLLGIGWEWE